MSARSGDKARYGRERKAKIHKRIRAKELQRALAEKAKQTDASKR